MLVLGPEPLLAERAVAGIVARAHAEDPEADVLEVPAARMAPATLVEVTSPSLFSARRLVVVTEAAELGSDQVDPLLAVAAGGLDDLGLVVVHSGSGRSRTVLDRLKKAAGETIDCPAAKPWELAGFVAAEARRLGSTTDTDAAHFLVDAVGHDLRSLAAAIAQLVADSDDEPVSIGQVRRYFGGRAEVTSFAVADATLAGRTGPAMEQLRWAISTGVAPVLVTSAFAAGLRGLGRLITAPAGLREPDLAREVGVPPWKVRSMRSQARGWDQRGLATALQVVAGADAEVKGAADDAEFALEQMVLNVARARRG